MEYLLNASGLVVILFLFYYLFLRNETFFKSIRSYFLVGLLIVLSIPLIEIPIYVEAAASAVDLGAFQQFNIADGVEESSFDWSQLWMYIYLGGVIVLSMKFLIQIASLAFLLSKHSMIKKGKYYFVETTNKLAPFSFFNIIFYNKAQFSERELEQIINHEKAHVIQWHSLDTILAHLLVITLWFNPFVWLYKKAVQQNLEFLADDYALQRSENEKLYQITLLKTCGTNYCTSLTNNFYNSLIKKRIVMLHKNRSKNTSQWKYAILLPCLVAFVFAFNTKVVAQKKKLVEVVEIHDEQEGTIRIINKDFTKDDLEKVKAELKEEGIEMSYSGLKYNDNNEITKISIKVKSGNSRGSATWENDGKPIPNIKVGEVDGGVVVSSSFGSSHGAHAYTTHGDGEVEIIEIKEGDGANYVISTGKGKHKKMEWKSKGDKKAKGYSYVIKEVSDAKDKKGEKIVVKEIKTDAGKAKVWVSKTDKKNNELVEVIEIEEVHEGDEIHEVEVVHESNVKGENVYIVKKGDKIVHKKNEKGDYIFFSGDTENALIIIDGKESNHKELDKLDPSEIKTVEVLKGKGATEKYGDKGKDGVILITTKKE